MIGEGVGENQRRDSLGPSGIHRDRNHAAEREAADVRAADAELGHRRQDGHRIIIARCALGRAVAVAVAGVSEGVHVDVSRPPAGSLRAIRDHARSNLAREAAEALAPSVEDQSYRKRESALDRSGAIAWASAPFVALNLFQGPLWRRTEPL